MADKSYLSSVLLSVCMLRSSALESPQCPYGENRCKDGRCVLVEGFCNTQKSDNSFPSYVFVIIGIFGFLIFVGLLMACYKSCANDSNYVYEASRTGFNSDVPYQTGRIHPPESRPLLSNHPGTSSNYQSTCRGYERVNPKTKGQGTNGFQSSRKGPSGINQPAMSMFGSSGINQPAMSMFGSAGINQPAMSSFGSSGINQPAMSRFGSAGINQPAMSMFGSSGINQPAMSSFGSSGINQPAMSRFGSAGINQPAMSRFDSAGINQPAMSRFGSAGINQPAMSRFGSSGINQPATSGYK